VFFFTKSAPRIAKPYRYTPCDIFQLLKNDAFHEHCLLELAPGAASKPQSVHPLLEVDLEAVFEGNTYPLPTLMGQLMSVKRPQTAC
ncbi:MAG: hypothetical protein U0894_08175, partial [Pirellulales bacterium]